MKNLLFTPIFISMSLAALPENSLLPTDPQPVSAEEVQITGEVREGYIQELCAVKNRLTCSVIPLLGLGYVTCSGLLSQVLRGQDDVTLGMFAAEEAGALLAIFLGYSLWKKRDAVTAELNELLESYS